MTKTEILNWLADQPFCDTIIDTPTAVADPQADGTQWYAVTIREVYENSAITRRIHFYVVNENETDERAYWKDSTPTATLAPTPNPISYKWVSYRTILAELDYSTASSIIAKIKAAAEADPVIEQVHAMLSSYGGSEPGVDINSQATQMLISEMVGNLLTQVEADAVIGMADAVIGTPSNVIE